MTRGSTNTKHIQELRSQLEESLQWGAASGWHSSMFTELSGQIFDKCQIMLSAATLKRFFGVVNHEGTPSISTLDTLSQFLDFANWRAFKLSSAGKPKFRLPANVTGKSVYVTLGFFLALVLIVVIGSKRANDPDILAAVSFSSRPVANSYPNSVVFDFDLLSVRSDSMCIQQYWDPNKTIQLKTGQKQATGIYYFPGHFRAKLMIDGQSVKEHDLFLKSDGWLGTLDYEPVPKYFAPILEGTSISYPPPLLDQVASLENPISTTYHFINDLGNISGDHFTLDASIKVAWNEKWAVCQAARIYIIGTEGAMIVPFSKIGCSSDNSLMLNDVYLSGKEHDLSAFASDLSDFTEIKIVTENKKVAVYISNANVYEGAYSESMGKLVGIRFKFLGLGEVNSYSIQDPQGVPILAAP